LLDLGNKGLEVDYGEKLGKWITNSLQTGAGILQSMQCSFCLKAFFLLKMSPQEIILSNLFKWGDWFPKVRSDIFKVTQNVEIEPTKIGFNHLISETDDVQILHWLPVLGWEALFIFALSLDFDY
jgi:hypothetical protein